MHVARLAETFGIRSVVVPWAAGVASAVGLVSSDLAVDLVQTRLVDLTDLSARVADAMAGLEAAFAELEARGRAELGDDPGAEFVVTRAADMRARGQAHQLTVAVPDLSLAALDRGVPRGVPRAAYGIDTDAPAQLVNVKVRVVRVVDKLTPRPEPVVALDAAGAVAGARPVYFPEAGGFTPTPVYRWTRLEPGNEFAGPAVVEGPDTTIVVPPGHRANVDQWRNVVLTRNI